MTGPVAQNSFTSSSMSEATGVSHDFYDICRKFQADHPNFPIDKRGYSFEGFSVLADSFTKEQSVDKKFLFLVNLLESDETNTRGLQLLAADLLFFGLNNSQKTEFGKNNYLI